jgi:tetratricopeptide (TPR) repeat protein
MVAVMDRSVDVSRYSRLLGFLDQDPDNLPLLADAASAAMEEGDPNAALALLDRYESLAPLPPPQLNLKGIAALADRRFEDAVATLTSLREAGEDAPAIRFNLAWALTMVGDHETALALLDDEAVAAGPRGASLKVGLLHRLGRPEEALESGIELARIHPADQSLMGALAIAAMDADRADLARLYGARAGTNHDGQTTLGLLLLDDGLTDESAAIFDRVLAGDAGNPRALLGKGLALLGRGDPASAGLCIDEAAENFGDHLGSWIAAGWAHYIRGDLDMSRARFETALALDDGFAETHGGLAVLDLAQGDVEGARRRADVALRLDRNCFAGALAKSLLLERDGKEKAARKVRQAALNFPIGVGGRSIAAALGTHLPGAGESGGDQAPRPD